MNTRPAHDRSELTPLGRRHMGLSSWHEADTSKARLYYPEDRVAHYDDQQLAYIVWLALPKGTRAAFRGAGDARPVYPHDCVDRP